MSNDKCRGLNEYNLGLNKALRESMREAFLLLLKEKKYEDITVSEICQKAGFSRTGFYSNYATKENLFNEIIESAFEKISGLLGSPFESNVGTEWYEKAFELLKDNIEVVKIVFNCENYFRYIETANKFAINKDGLSESEKCRRLMWNGAFQNITLFWIENGAKEQPYIMAKYCCDCLSFIN